MFGVDISKVVLSDPWLLHRVGRCAPSLNYSLSSLWFQRACCVLWYVLKCLHGKYINTNIMLSLGRW